MEAARTVGQPTLRLQTFRPTDALFDIPIAVYGESLFAIILTSKLKHVVLEPTSDWLVNLPEKYTRRDISKTTLGHARAFAKPYFVKNADGMKAFEAQVYQSGEELPTRDYYPDDYEVLVSEPIDWEVEYRCFIHERTLATMSIYLKNGDIARTANGDWLENTSEQNEAHKFCQTLLDNKDVAIPPACVIDVGRTSRGWAVVEANPAYGSGIYGCDTKEVLRVINRATLHIDDITERDSLWVTTYEVED